PDIVRAYMKTMAGEVLASTRKRPVSGSPIYGTRIFEVYIPLRHWMISKKACRYQVTGGYHHPER
ncbi:MAG: hypothetical protein ACXQTA_03250, partial [Candidatus Syntropharchaeales archaeon]